MGARTVSSDEDEVEEREDDMEDNEAGVDDIDEEEEEEDMQDEYEKDDFIVDDLEEEEGEEEPQASSEEEAKAKKKKRKKRDAEENYELDEDDYELLQEANVTGFHRPKSQQSNKTKFKRLKKAGKVATEGERGGKAGFSDEEELEEGSRHGRTAEEELKRSLFGDDEGAPPEDIGEEEEAEEEEEDIGEDDEMADFIVDEELVDENGQPVRRGKARKRGPRQAAGISSMALQEAQDIFGDVTELLDRRKFGLNAERADEDDSIDGISRSSKKKLEEEFEPSILEERYMTKRDNRIRETDVPERLQLLEEVTGPIPAKEPKFEEAEWIYDQNFGSSLDKADKKDSDWKANIVRQIAHVLTMLHDSKLEIPFIGMYRKEGCRHLIGEPLPATDRSKPMLRDFKLLWQIFAIDKKWWLLQRKKDALRQAYEKRLRIEEQKGSENLDLLKRLLGALVEARSQASVDDIDAKNSLHFPPDEQELDVSQFKRPKRKSIYNDFRKAGFGAVARQFGLSSEQLGENFQAMYKRHEVEDSSSSPEDLASEYSSSGERLDPQSVLRSARHMAAVEISTEPAVRDYVRKEFLEKAVVTTKPTKDGNTVIDPYHDCAVVKWISAKPFSAFKDGQWLLIQKAEEERLIEVTVGLPKAVVSSLMQEFENMYLSDGVSRTAQLWNEQRRQIVKDAISGMLLPLLEKEARMLLTTRAKQWVGLECGAALWAKVATAPWKDSVEEQSDVRSEERGDDEELPRVLSCCHGDSAGMSTTFVMLDSTGEIVDTLYTPHLIAPESDPRRQNDMHKLTKFMLEYQPQVAVVGAGGGLKSVHIRKAIEQAVFTMVEKFPRDIKREYTVTKEILDETLARIYEASNISKEQLPGQPGIVRRAVFLGRYLQGPLAMVASLCGPNREILSYTFHELQKFLTDDERYAVIEQVMVTITNQVGVDINMAAAHEWLFSPLQFVCGLGARKASAMQRSIQGAGRISTRKEMFMVLRLMKKTVFFNASAYFRICGSGQAASGNQIMDLLDDTRIHPESYDLAKRMAVVVYREVHKNRQEELEEDLVEVAIEHLKDDPQMMERLRLMDVDEYSKMLEESDDIKKPETLKDIQMELLDGYRDWRYAYKSPSDEEVFTMLTGESERTLGVGKVVVVKVKEVTERGIRCEVGNGLHGFIMKDDYADDSKADHQQVSVGSMIACRVKHINKRIFASNGSERARFYSVDLTCKASAMLGDDWERVWSKEPYFSREALKLNSEQEKATKAKYDEKRKSFKPRMIVHPQFQNVSMADAIEALTEKDVGEIIIRPSSKGPTHLSITLKMYDGVYTHIDILEGGKDSKDFTSFLSLGKSLKIGEDIFEDLDEVIARYVDPLVINLKDMLRYRKFRRGRKEEVDALLKQEKLANPSRIAYAFSVSYEHPGAFLLSYLRSSNVHHEYISLYPKGYRFRKKLFEKLDKLVKYFQDNVNDTVSEPNRSLAAMVPMKSPAPAPAAAAGAGGGWVGVDRRSPAVWDNNGWNAAKNAGQSSWQRLPAPSSIAGADWNARAGGVEHWPNEAPGDAWDNIERGPVVYNMGRGAGRGDSATRFGGGGGYRSGLRPGGFRAGRGSGRRGGRWDSRDGKNTRGGWTQGHGGQRGGWTQANTTTAGRNNDGGGWGQHVDASAERNDGGGWGQQEQSKHPNNTRGDQQQNKDSNDGWGNDNDDGWGQQPHNTNHKDDGWGEEGQ